MPPVMTAETADRVSPARTVRRVTVLCHVVPYPPNHGGSVDLWNMVRGLDAIGVRVQLVCWHGKERMAPEVAQRLREIAAEIVEVPRRDGWWRALYLTLPPRALSCKPSAAEYRRLRDRVREFAPDWLVLDNWLGVLAARALRRDLRIPLLYRSQNVEFRYFRELLRAATGIARFKLWANATRLFRLERSLRLSADLIADISEADRAEWTSLGAAGVGRVLPPRWLDPASTATPGTVRDIDLLFVGNLRSPNNLEGLSWFLREVLPVVRKRHGGEPLRVVLAGSDPGSKLVDECARTGVTCMANPLEVASLYLRARVTINPVRRGSGVNLKMVEAFANGMAVTATPAAVRGLPAALRDYFPVAGDDAPSFAAAVLEALSGDRPLADPAERARLVDREFGVQGLRSLLDEMTRIAADFDRVQAG